MYLENEKHDSTSRGSKAILGLVVLGAVLGIGGWLVGQWVIGLEKERDSLVGENRGLTVAMNRLQWKVESLESTSKIPAYEQTIEELKRQLSDKEQFSSHLAQSYREQSHQLQQEYSGRLQALYQQMRSQPSTQGQYYHGSHSSVPMTAVYHRQDGQRRTLVINVSYVNGHLSISSHIDPSDESKDWFEGEQETTYADNGP